MDRKITNVTNIEKMVPAILDQVEIGKWERKAALLGLVASITWEGGSWAQVGRREIATSFGREDRAARYDLELMHRMAEEDRVLRHSGHHAGNAGLHLWRVDAVGPEALIQWRHVPWKTSRSEAIRRIRALCSAVTVAPVVESAGQPWCPVDLRGDFPPSADPDLSVKEGPPAPRLGPPAPRNVPLTTGPRSTGATPPPATDYAFRDTSYPSLPREGGRGPSCARERPAGELIAALSHAIACDVFGAPADRLDAWIEEHPEQLDSLVARASGMRGWRTATGAVDALLTGVAGLGATSARAFSKSCEHCGVYRSIGEACILGRESCGVAR